MTPNTGKQSHSLDRLKLFGQSKKVQLTQGYKRVTGIHSGLNKQLFWRFLRHNEIDHLRTFSILHPSQSCHLLCCQELPSAQAVDKKTN